MIMRFGAGLYVKGRRIGGPRGRGASGEDTSEEDTSGEGTSEDVDCLSDIVELIERWCWCWRAEGRCKALDASEVS